jgi:sec-independent protein translocase protein TatB
VFGLSFGELVMLLLVAVVVLGPKEMPRYLRKAGQFAGRLRQIAFDMRTKSGIDEVLRSEGLDQDIAEIRRLAATNGVRLSDVPSSPYAPAAPGASSPSPVAPLAPIAAETPMLAVDRGREYPAEGPDTYGALPETSSVYEGDLPTSPLATDPLYTRGDDVRPAVEASS